MLDGGWGRRALPCLPAPVWPWGVWPLTPKPLQPVLVQGNGDGLVGWGGECPGPNRENTPVNLPGKPGVQINVSDMYSTENLNRSTRK